jgi:heat shock protein HtpX
MEHFQQGLLQRLLLPGRRQPNPSLLRTHPHTDERVRRLRELAGRTPEREPMPDYLGEEAAELPRAFRRVRRAPRWHVGGFWY